MDQNLKRKAEEADEVETKKIRIEKPAGWSDLSVKIKLQILNDLDFKSRLRLRAVSSADRHLIDSQKLKVDSLAFFGTWLSVKTEFGKLHTPIDRYITNLPPERKAAIFSLLAYILRVGKIEEMRISTCDRHSINAMRDEFVKLAPVQVERLLSEGIIARYLFRLLPCISCQQMELCHSENFNCFRLLELPAILGAQDVFFNATCPTKTVSKVIRKWIENDVAIGTHFQMNNRNTIKRNVKKEWSGRFVPKLVRGVPDHLRNIVKIRTDNKEKMILVDCPKYEMYILCVVVPSNLDIDDENVFCDAYNTYLCSTPSGYI